ncbi:unnamed protein product [Macrosiphum euphorbiae]|uniref:Uncharacterized protein n=1 Tax=Macrosiphum euphorbiae TaxID=13131 RepID=A0AAV0WAT0_9HEMI|nr:unnamed protein product [Macrosiphum euphorbiae]
MCIGSAVAPSHLSTSRHCHHYDDGRRTPTYKRKRRNELDKDEKCKHRIQKFRLAWTSQPEFKTWLRPDLDNPNKAHCIKCNISFTAELTVIKNHAKGKKHKKIASASSVCSQNIIKKFTAPQSHEDT